MSTKSDDDVLKELRERTAATPEGGQVQFTLEEFVQGTAAQIKEFAAERGYFDTCVKAQLVVDVLILIALIVIWFKL